MIRLNYTKHIRIKKVYIYFSTGNKHKNYKGILKRKVNKIYL